ncbi:MAG TPA: DUF1491 family protein [Sneathiellales bacterium]|nr:DUF1491 family protein [Sneathiellales bacterium]
MGKLKAGLWVKARIRQCDLMGIPIVVARRGDADAGAILVKLVHPGGFCNVLTQFRNLEGDLQWVPAIGEEAIVEVDADAFICRQVERDRDLWVIEIEDHLGTYILDE